MLPCPGCVCGSKYIGLAVFETAGGLCSMRSFWRSILSRWSARSLSAVDSLMKEGLRVVRVGFLSSGFFERSPSPRGVAHGAHMALPKDSKMFAIAQMCPDAVFGSVDHTQYDSTIQYLRHGLSAELRVRYSCSTARVCGGRWTISSSSTAMTLVPLAMRECV